MINKLTTTLFALIIFLSISAQTEKSYIDKKENKHLCGPFELNDLTTDTTYSSWYNENFESFQPELKNKDWAEKLKKTQVDIYIVTWCGDSKTWLPRFMKLCSELGLEEDQINLIALYNGDEKYKQGPNSEEVGKKIHRVPTFIF